MRGSRRLPTVAPHPGEDGGLCICIDVPGLNRAAYQECLWPSHVGCCEGPPHNYVRMPFGLPNAVAAHQRLLRSILEAQEVRHRAALAEMEMALRIHLCPGGSRGSKPREIVRVGSLTVCRPLLQHSFVFNGIR